MKLGAAALVPAQGASAPVVYWSSGGVRPGDAVLLYGGGLAGVREVRITAGGRTATAEALQPSDGSVKFILPKQLPAGVFSVQAGNAKAVRVNAPEIWFAQPTRLAPGLMQNQAPAGAELEIVGKNFDHAPRVELRREGRATPLKVLLANRYSLTVKLPETLADGKYQLHVGEAAAALEIRKPDVWPDKVFNVRDFGALGDDVTDDTAAIRKTIAAAEANSGGVVYFPFGTYRLSDYIFVPDRTVLRGEGRDISQLKWPADEPKDITEFSVAAIYTAACSAIEDLTVIVRKVNYAILDLSYENNYARTIPAELAPRMKPWGGYRDLFLRRIHVQHWLLAGHPERATALSKKYGDGANNFIMCGCKNFEVSDSIFQGGNQQFISVENARIVRNSFSNTMGYAWTCLGGGAKYEICTDNELRCSSSWGWGWSGIQYVYSARNRSYNFVRGEREAMTADVSAMPTARPVWQHWGTPSEVDNGAKPSLRFKGVKWTPGCFRDGQAIIRAYTGGAGAGQTRNILDNTEDTLLLDKPWQTPPETAERKMYMEIAPRHARAHNGTCAWVGRLKQVEALAITADKAHWVPDEFIGMAAMILDGQGAGQYRVITRNSENRAVLERAWDAEPDTKSVIGIWSMMRHMIVHECEGYDTSAFAQLYGSAYEYIVDGCKVVRNQGVWGQSGWFVQYLNNDVSVGYSYHPGIGFGGRAATPEKNTPYSIVGLSTGRLRITKSRPFQYAEGNKLLFVDEVVGHLPGGLGTIVRGNRLRYNQRVAVGGSSPQAGFRDVLVDGNTVEDSAVGVQLGSNVTGALVTGNRFARVAKPYDVGSAKVIE